MTGAASFAQITITEWDIIGYGEFIDRATDTMPTISHGLGGADQTWNYSTGLTPHLTENFGFGSASWYPGYSEFPDANLGSYNSADGSTVFINKHTDAIDLLGFYGDIAGTGNDEAIVFDPYERLISFPSTYETEFFNSYTFTLTIDGAAFSVDSVVIESSTDKTSNIDAWGEITTPLGTFETIRQYTYKATTNVINAYLMGASVFNDTEVIEEHIYSFWTNDANSRFIVLEYTYDPNLDEITEATWQTSSPILSVEENTLSAKHVYPNPASETLFIEFAEDGVYDYEIVDALGRTVKTGEFSDAKNSLSVIDLENGIYSLHLINKGLNQLNVQRFVIQH